MRLNQAAVSAGRYQLEQRDWLEAQDAEPADLVASCMVLEHLAEADEARYLERCRKALKRGTPHAERIRRLYNERASPKIEEKVE